MMEMVNTHSRNLNSSIKKKKRIQHEITTSYTLQYDGHVPSSNKMTRCMLKEENVPHDIKGEVVTTIDIFFQSFLFFCHHILLSFNLVFLIPLNKMTYLKGRIGILLKFPEQSSCPCTSQQNDIFERKNRHFVEISQTLLLHANVCALYQSGPILTSYFLIKRMPSSSLDHKTLLSILFSKKNPCFIFLLEYLGALVLFMTCLQILISFLPSHTMCFLGY